MGCSDQEHLVWYALTLCTSNVPAAGTDADVFVTIHGKQGSSPRIKLPSRPEDFLRGGEDTFRMELHALGEIVKLTVGHNNMGSNPGWHVDHAELVDEETGRACLLQSCCSHSLDFNKRGNICLRHQLEHQSGIHSPCSAYNKMQYHADALALLCWQCFVCCHQRKVQP